jgi:hypothetical protein
MPVPNSSPTNPIPRPGWGCFFFTAPLAFALLVTGAYVVLFGVGMQGTSARGERVAIAFETCPEARALLSERVAHIGLGDPVFTRTPTGLLLHATLPDGPAAQHIPATLARTGHFAIRSGEGPDGPQVLTRADIVSAEFSLKEMGNPLVLLRLTPVGRKALESHMEADPDGRIGVWIDDEPVLIRGNTPPFRRPEIDVRAEGTDGVDNMRRAVDWGMLITYGPLPCPAAASSVTALTE